MMMMMQEREEEDDDHAAAAVGNGEDDGIAAATGGGAAAAAAATLANQSRKRRRFGHHAMEGEGALMMMGGGVGAAASSSFGLGRSLATNDPSIINHIVETFIQLQVFQRKGLLCDLILIPQDDKERRLPCHACIMASSSLYIKALLTGQLGKGPMDMTKGPQEISLAFDYSTLHTLVNFAYGGGLDICGESVAALLAASDFLRIENAVVICCQWLLHNLSLDNVFLIRELAIEYRQTHLLEAVSRFFLEQFEQVIHLPEFLDLHPTDLDGLLSSDDVVVHGEMDVYRSLVRWTEADLLARKDDFTRLFFKHIRLEFIQPRQLKEIMDEKSALAQCRSPQIAEICREVLMERCPPYAPPSPPTGAGCLLGAASSSASSLSSPSLTRSSSTISTTSCSSFSSSSSSSSLTPSDGRNRRWKLDRSIYMLGGRSHEQTHLKSVRHYLAHKGRWTPAAEMNTARAFLGVTTLDDDVIYAVGGYNEEDSFLDTVEYYSPIHGEWQYARSLNIPRASLGLCALGGSSHHHHHQHQQQNKKLIAVGGENRGRNHHHAEGQEPPPPVYLSSVEIYDQASNAWSMASEMSTPRSFIGLAQVSGGGGGGDEGVFAVGGYDGEDYLQTVERYDAHQDRWSVVASLNAPRSCCGVATTGDGRLLYVAGGYNTDHCLKSVEMYDARANLWRNVAPLEVERSYLSMVEFDNSLYAIGGLDSEEQALTTIERYDPALDKWFEMPSLSSAVYACGLCVVNEET